MPRPSDAGPNPDRLPLNRMPVDRLQEVLPEGSPVGDAVDPPPPPPPVNTGIISGNRVDVGNELWLFDDSQFVLMADFTPGTGSTGVTDIVEADGNLYVFGYSSPATTQLVSVWDADTRVATSLLSSAAAGYATDPYMINGNIYFVLVSSSGSSNSLAMIDTSTDTLTYIMNPGVGGPIYHLDGYGDGLVLTGAFTGGADLVWFEPDNEIEPIAVYTLSNDGIVSNLLGGVGNFYYFQAYSPLSEDYGLYRIDLSIGEVSLVEDNLLITNIDRDASQGELGDGLLELGGALYLPAFIDEQTFELLKLDSSGQVTSILSTGGNSINVLDQNGDSAWLWSGTQVHHLTTGGLTTYTTSISYMPYGQEFNGTLYVGAILNNEYGLYKLNTSTGDFDFVFDFTPNANGAFPIGTVNGHLILLTDRDGDSRNELWSSDTPDDLSSWVQISPSDVNVNVSYLATLDGDYLI